MGQWVKKPQYIDLTREISEGMVVYPGDPPFVCEPIRSISAGSKGSVNFCCLHFGNHIGTHIDFPSHVIAGGKTSSDFGLNDLIGEGCIIEVPEQILTITADFVAKSPIRGGDFVFFKTKSSKMSEFDPIPEKIVHLDSSAAEALIEKGVRIVGIDYVSIDALDAADLPVHHLLLSKNILIVEGLNLKNMEEGRGEIFIAPLNVAEIDGVPARVFMRRE